MVVGLRDRGCFALPPAVQGGAAVVRWWRRDRSRVAAIFFFFLICCVARCRGFVLVRTCRLGPSRTPPFLGLGGCGGLIRPAPRRQTTGVFFVPFSSALCTPCPGLVLRLCGMLRGCGGERSCKVVVAAPVDMPRALQSNFFLFCCIFPKLVVVTSPTHPPHTTLFLCLAAEWRSRLWTRWWRR